MSSSTSRRPGTAKPRAAAATAALVAAALFSSACATSEGPPSPPAVAEPEGGGFAIHEEVSVGLGVRSDFDDAVRLLREEAYDEGIERLLEVIEAAPNLAAAHINLGRAYRETGDLEHALECLERAVALSPGHPVAYNELGIVQRQLGRFGEARASYETALDLHPDFHFARRNLAILCDLYLADPSCALEHYEIYGAAVPNDAEAAMWTADLRNRVGR